MSHAALGDQAPPAVAGGALAGDIAAGIGLVWRAAERGGASGAAVYARAETGWQRIAAVGAGETLPTGGVGGVRLQRRATRRPPFPVLESPPALWIPLADAITIEGWLAIVAPEGAPLWGSHGRRRILRAARWTTLGLRGQRHAEEARQARTEADLLRRVTILLNTTSDLDKALSLVVHEIRAGGGYAAVTLYRHLDGLLVQHDRGRQAATPSLPALSLRQGIVGRAARGLQTQWVVDVQADPDFLGGPPDVVGEIAVPLHYKGRLLGVLSVQSSAGRPFTRHDMPLLEAVAGAMNVSLENQRLTGESQQRLASLESLWAMSADLNAKLGLPDLLEAVLRRAAAVSAAAHGGIFLVDPRREDLVLTAGYHWPADGELRLPAGEGIAGRAVSARMPLVVGNSSSGSGRLSRASRSDGGTTLAVPIVWGDVAMGAIVLTHPDARRGFDRATVQIVSAFAAQAGSAIHTARLYEAEQRKARQLEAIQQINRQVAMSLDRHALLSQVIALVGSHLSYPTVCLYLIQGDHAVPAAGDVDRSPVRLGEGVIGWVARMGQSVLVPDGEPTPTLLDAGTLPTSRAQLAVPISMGSQVLGVLDVQSQTPNEFDEVDELGLSAVASQTAVALVNAEHFQDATRRAEELSALYATAQAVSVELSLNDVLQTIVNKARELTGAMGAEVNLLTADGQRECVACSASDRPLRLGLRQPANSGLLGVALTEGRALLVNNAQADPRLGSRGRERGVTGLVIVPLQIKGETIGALTVVNGPEGRGFSQRDLRLMRVFAQQAALALNNAQLYEAERERVQQLGLVNRIARLTTASLQVDTVLETAVQSLTADLGLTRAAVLLHHGSSDVLHVEAVSHRAGSGGGCHTCLEPRSGLCRAAFVRGEVVVARDGAVDAQPCCLLDHTRPESAMAAPLRQGDQALGTLLVVRDAPGSFKPTDVAVMQAVADQLAAAVTAGRLYEATVEARQRAETIMNEAQAGLVVVDSGWRVVALNPAAAAMLGPRAWAAVGRPVRRVIDDPRASDLLARADEASDSETRQMVEVHIAAEGRDALMGVAPLRPGYLISLLDVTALKEVDRLKSEIVANFSHELRAPLTSIKAYTELLLHFHDRHEALPQQFLSIVDQETDRLTDLVNDVLDLSRLEAGRPQMEHAAVSLPALIEEIVTVTRAQAAHRQIDIGVEVAPGIPRAWGDRQLLGLILRNLIVNAVKYNKPGGSVMVMLDTTSRDEAIWLRLRVRDSGIGIPADAMPHLFEKFYRVSSTTESGIQGTGLGLPLVKAAVEAHGGEIRVVSEIGDGTEFTVLLPAALPVGMASS